MVQSNHLLFQPGVRQPAGRAPGAAAGGAPGQLRAAAGGRGSGVGGGACHALHALGPTGGGGFGVVEGVWVRNGTHVEFGVLGNYDFGQGTEVRDRVYRLQCGMRLMKFFFFFGWGGYIV